VLLKKQVHGWSSALRDAAESCVVGGKNFTAATLVLLAGGKAIPICSLKPGEKVLATNTTNGKTRAEAISVVMVHYSTNAKAAKRTRSQCPADVCGRHE
jgi:hypothetical protein